MRFSRACSITLWVPMLAWSLPGSQRVGSPRMRCQRIIRSSMAITRAWPMCSFPVILEGGMEITNGF